VQPRTLKQWIPFFVWVVLIFVGSSIPRLPGNPFGLPQWSDKVAHFLEYLVLAFLFYRGIRGGRGRMGIPVWLIVLAAGFVIASIDEFHQQYIPGRDANGWDWTADMAGVAVGALIGMKRYAARARRPENA
jgi:VanZ family protein